MEKIKYIDLFSGIGGFHLAMNELNGECVFASEIDKFAIRTYQDNFGIDSNNDITKVKPEELPGYEMMCAGFPCQTFSKAGKQRGFDETRGTLFFDMLRLLKYRVDNGDPVKYLLFENVRNLISHDFGNTYKVIMSKLHELGYYLNDEPIVMSPHQFGIPQLRERAFILGIHNTRISNKPNLNVLPHKGRNKTDAFSIVQRHRVGSEYYISDYEKNVLSAWDEFYKGIIEKTIGFPIWAEYFNKLKMEDDMPKWKKDFILRNVKLYETNKLFIDGWLKKYNHLKGFVRTHRKFEWQCGENCKSVWEGIIQFRPSGVRVKRPTEFPALVAMVHVPIIGKYKRRITPLEMAKLQSYPAKYKINKIKQQAYKQFGNSVNVKVIEFLLKKLLVEEKNGNV